MGVETGAQKGFLGKATKAMGFDGPVGGGWGGVAVLVGFSLVVMTLSKTVLYGEALSVVLGGKNEVLG